MSADPKTMSFYAGAAAKYAGKFGRTKPDQDLLAFMGAVIPGGRVLDLGCGPGNTAAMLRDAGFVAEASDASPEMAALAHEKFGIDVAVQDFDALDAAGRYEGIWANFSLLHARRADLPRYLGAIHRALVPGGVFHIGLKVGEGEEYDHLDRFYTYYSVDELRGLLAGAGFDVTSVREGKAKGMAGTLDPFVIMLARA